MKAAVAAVAAVALSRPSDGGQFETDGGEVQSKNSMETGSRCSSWTDEKHMVYLSSLEESFVTQLHGSQFHLHLMNLLGRSRTNLRRESESSITTESLSDSSQDETQQQVCRDEPKFVKTKLGVQKEIASLSLSESQWIKHFTPSARGKGADVRTNCQTVDHQSSYSKNFVKKEHCCDSKESTLRAQPSISSHNHCGYGEVSDQNFINADITGAESSHHTCKKIRLSSPVTPLNDQGMLGKQHYDAIIEKG